MKRVVLDMDPGVDDAVALLLALNNPEIEVAGVTTVSGNVSLRKGTANAIRVIDAFSKHVPVYKGASHPRRGRSRLRAESIHGSDGLGNAGLPLPRRRAEKIGAVEWMAELLNSSRNKEISIVATGPLTNIAMLLEKEPSLSRRLDRIFVMGGLYDPNFRGNVTKYSEFNFYSDPDAADIVMKMTAQGWPNVTVAGLEVTSNCLCAVDGKTIKKACAIGSRASELACKILRWPVQKYSFFNLHDVFALFAIIYPEIFTFKKCAIRVAQSGKFVGRCTVSSENANVRVCKKVVPEKFNQRLLADLR